MAKTAAAMMKNMDPGAMQGMMDMAARPASYIFCNFKSRRRHTSERSLRRVATPFACRPGVVDSPNSRRQYGPFTSPDVTPSQYGGVIDVVTKL